MLKGNCPAASEDSGNSTVSFFEREKSKPKEFPDERRDYFKQFPPRQDGPDRNHSHDIFLMENHTDAPAVLENKCTAGAGVSFEKENEPFPEETSEESGETNEAGCRWTFFVLALLLALLLKPL